MGILQNLIDGVYKLDGLVTSNGCSTSPDALQKFLDTIKNIKLPEKTPAP